MGSFTLTSHLSPGLPGDCREGRRKRLFTEGGEPTPPSESPAPCRRPGPLSQPLSRPRMQPPWCLYRHPPCSEPCSTCSQGPPPETEPGGQAPGTVPRLQAHPAALGGGTPQVSLSLISCSGWELPSVQVTLPKPLPFPSQGAPLQAPRTAAALTSLRAARGPWTPAASERQRDQMKPARLGSEKGARVKPPDGGQGGHTARGAITKRAKALGPETPALHCEQSVRRVTSGGAFGHRVRAQAGWAESKPPELTPSPPTPHPDHTTLPEPSTSTAALEQTVPSSAEMAPLSRQAPATSGWPCLPCPPELPLPCVTGPRLQPG